MKALFGALYTLAKEKMNDSARMAYLTIGVDFILICLLFLMPEYPWAADEHNPCVFVSSGWLGGRWRQGGRACPVRACTLYNPSAFVPSRTSGYSRCSSTLSSTCR